MVVFTEINGRIERSNVYKPVVEKKSIQVIRRCLDVKIREKYYECP